jgi:RHS repeat-associated protein
MNGIATSEVTETLDSMGGLASRRVVANMQGRGGTIGRVVRTDTGDAAQYYVKNHLGSTVRVVNADGSYANMPVFDYQPYGELQGIREDSLNAVARKFTGKELDSTVNLYDFGARWYDPELGMWVSADPAGQYADPYAYGGDPENSVDDDGRVIVWVNGVKGKDDPIFRDKLCADHPEWCSKTNNDDAAIHADNYGHGFWADVKIANSPFKAWHESRRVYSAIQRAYEMDRDPDNKEYYETGVHVVAHSGGAATSGYAVGRFNMTHGYGSVDSRTTVAGWDPLALGRNYSYVTGTRTDAYYNGGDWISYAAALNDLLFGMGPDSKVDVFNLDHWCLSNHGNEDPNCRSVNDKIKDTPFLGRVYEWEIAKPADHISRGLTNGYENYVNPFNYAHDSYTFWRDFDWDNPSDYGDAALLAYRKRNRLGRDIVNWMLDW